MPPGKETRAAPARPPAERALLPGGGALRLGLARLGMTSMSGDGAAGCIPGASSHDRLTHEAPHGPSRPPSSSDNSGRMARQDADRRNLIETTPMSSRRDVLALTPAAALGSVRFASGAAQAPADAGGAQAIEATVFRGELPGKPGTQTPAGLQGRERVDAPESGADQLPGLSDDRAVIRAACESDGNGQQPVLSREHGGSPERMSTSRSAPMRWQRQAFRCVSDAMADLDRQVAGRSKPREISCIT